MPTFKRVPAAVFDAPAKPAGRQPSPEQLAMVDIEDVVPHDDFEHRLSSSDPLARDRRAGMIAKEAFLCAKENQAFVILTCRVPRRAADVSTLVTDYADYVVGVAEDGTLVQLKNRWGGQP